jgi:hypothetical protein
MFSDAMKVVMIEMLGDESLEAGGALDDATMKAIIQDRNHYVMDDLVRLVEREPALGSIAVFYGAGHMKDLEARLEKRLGYVPLDEKPRWFRAFGVDLEKSHLSPDMVEALRRTIRSRLEGLRGR